MKEKITKEEFSFHGYFSSHYGLGPQPEMMPANVKAIVLGVILFIAGIVVTTRWVSCSALSASLR